MRPGAARAGFSPRSKTPYRHRSSRAPTLTVCCSRCCLSTFAYQAIRHRRGHSARSDLIRCVFCSLLRLLWLASYRDVIAGLARALYGVFLRYLLRLFGWLRTETCSLCTMHDVAAWPFLRLSDLADGVLCSLYAFLGLPSLTYSLLSSDRLVCLLP